MDDAVVEGRLGGLSLLLAQVLVTLARRAEDADAFIDEIEGHCLITPMKAKDLALDELGAVRAVNVQVEDTLRLARELNQFRTYRR